MAENSTFSSSSSQCATTIHDQKHHLLRCPLCPQRFDTKSRVLCHLKMHDSERLHECAFCTFSANKAATLKLHTMTHRPMGAAQAAHTSTQTELTTVSNNSPANSSSRTVKGEMKNTEDAHITDENETSQPFKRPRLEQPSTSDGRVSGGSPSNGQHIGTHNDTPLNFVGPCRHGIPALYYVEMRFRGNNTDRTNPNDLVNKFTNWIKETNRPELKPQTMTILLDMAIREEQFEEECKKNIQAPLLEFVFCAKVSEFEKLYKRMRMLGREPGWDEDK